MKKTEFTQKRNVQVSTDQGVFSFNSYAEIVGYFNDVSNHETWAVAHKNHVFVCHTFDTIGKIVETFKTPQEAKDYAYQLNDFFAVCEEYSVEEI